MFISIFLLQGLLIGCCGVLAFEHKMKGMDAQPKHQYNIDPGDKIIKYTRGKGIQEKEKCEYRKIASAFRKIFEKIIVILLPTYIFIALENDIEFLYLQQYTGQQSILLGLLYILSIYDLKYMIIPDELIIGILIMSVAENKAISDGIIAFLILIFIGLVTSIIAKREAIGGGDIKLIGALGFYMGWERAICAYFIGTLLVGTVAIILMMIKIFKSEKVYLMEECPLGPFITISVPFLL